MKPHLGTILHPKKRKLLKKEEFELLRLCGPFLYHILYHI